MLTARQIETARRSVTTPGAVRYADKLSDCVIYTYRDGFGRPALVSFLGQSIAPDLKCFYSSERQREADARGLFSDAQDRLADEIVARLNRPVPYRR